MGDQVQNPRSAAAIMDLILPLALSHPSIPALLALQPLAHPSAVPHSTLVKFGNRLNAAVLGRDGEKEARFASATAERLIRDDQEGWIISEYGKGWTNVCLTELANNGVSIYRLSLLENLILVSPQYPSFEREVIHPIMGKVAVTLTRSLDSLVKSDLPDIQVLSSLLSAMYNIINHSPAPFRANLSTLRPALHSLLVPTAESLAILQSTEGLKEKAADCLAFLHLTNGKAQIPSSWSSEMKSALGGMGMAMNGIVGEGWVEDTFRVVPPAAPSGFSLPSDAAARLPLALAHLEGWVEVVLALLRFPTTRAVPVPIAQLVAAGLRCLNLTMDTPTFPYISPQHRASLVASLPQIWTAGLHIVAAVANAVGDHLFPHLSVVLDHTVWLAETVPASMRSTHLQLLRFHSFFLEQYPSSLVPVEYPTRLLRLSLGQLAPLLDTKAPLAPAAAQMNGGSSTSKRGKKRARGAEDGLVGGLEGRDRANLAQEEVDVIVESLRLVPLIHPTPTLAPALLTFSIRLHISLYLGLPTISHLLHPPTEEYRVKEALTSVLERAALMTEGEAGTSRGWKTVIMSVLDHSGDAFSSLLHPSLPAMHRPQPPLANLHYFAPESEEEKRLRLELGFTTTGDAIEQEGLDVDTAQPDHAAARPNVTVSTQDTHPSVLPTTRTAPAPSTSDLTLQAHLLSDRQAVPHAMITSPAIINALPINLDSQPPIHNAQAIEDRAMASTSAPLQASSFMGYPQIPVGKSVGSMAENAKKEKVTVPEQALHQGGGDDEEDEPLPEMDSDMDLSDEDEDME